MKMPLPLKTMQDAVLFDERAQNVVDRPDLMPAYHASSRAMAGAGVLAGSEALHPTHTATTVRLREGRRQRKD
jgi:hypothetical protein